MSANNYILVKENKKNFKVMMLDADNGHQLGKAQRVQGLRNAIQLAQEIVREENVEYGIDFNLIVK